MLWMRNAMLPLLVSMLRLAYEAAGSPEYEAKLIKVNHDLLLEKEKILMIVYIRQLVFGAKSISLNLISFNR